MRPQSSVGFGEKYLQAQECGQSYVLYSYWSKGNAGTHFEKTRGARIRSRFRSINAHDEQNRLSSDELDTLRRSRKPYCGTHSQWRSAYKRGSTSIRSRSWISSWQCNYSKKRLLFYRLVNSAKTTDIPMSGSAVKNHGWPKRGRQLYAKRTTSYLLLFQGYPPVLGAIRRQHRHRRICLQQVQLKSEVTD